MHSKKIESSRKVTQTKMSVFKNNFKYILFFKSILNYLIKRGKIAYLFQCKKKSNNCIHRLYWREKYLRIFLHKKIKKQYILTFLFGLVISMAQFKWPDTVFRRVVSRETKSFWFQTINLNFTYTLASLIIMNIHL